MMSTAFERLLERYGQRVEVVREGNEAGTAARAFVQSVQEKREDKLPSPLGVGRQDRFLYLGEPNVPLDDLEGGYVVWDGRKLDVMNAQKVYVGSELSHWWAVLTARDEDEVRQ